jgi:hypothetical protein
MSMGTYPGAAMERAMKVQDVMLQAMAKKITWSQAGDTSNEFSMGHYQRVSTVGGPQPH